jgi:hypothetical protein
MSTTYYWYRPRELDRDAFQAWGDDCRKIIEAAGNDQKEGPVAIRGEDGTGQPVISPDLIALNGDASAGLEFEPFVVPRIMKKEFRDRADEQGRIFRFCKVAGRPYERVVAACLAAFERRFGPAVQIEADASGDLHFPRPAIVRAE